MTDQVDITTNGLPLGHENSLTVRRVEIVKGSDRKVSGRAVRTSWAKMSLSQEQEQAERDLIYAYSTVLRGSGYAFLGYGAINFDGVKGGSGNADQLEKTQKSLRRLKDWQKQTPKKFVQAVEALSGVLYGAMTANEMARRTGLSRSTITTWYKSGLDSWADLFLKS